MCECPEKKNKSLFFLISILLHLLLLYICFYFLAYQNSYKTAADKAAIPKADQNLSQPQEELAQMKARQSGFGAPVIFQETPEDLEREAVVAENDADGTKDFIIGQEESTDSHSKVSEGIDGTPTLSEVEKSLSPEHENAHLEHMLVDATHDADPIPVAGKETTVDDTKQVPSQKIASEESEVERKEKHQLPTLGKDQPSTRVKRPTTAGQGNAKKYAGPADKKFTFADLANGFMENIQAGGKDAINQRGNPNLRPGIEQLQKSSYKQKMAWNLQAAFKRAARRTKFIIPPPKESRLQCTFYIKKDGTLEKLQLVSSTGHQELDSYILKTIKDAFPIPPIPAHWKKETITETWTFRDVQPTDVASYTVNF